MTDLTVRLLGDSELVEGARLVGGQMLGSVADDAAQGWAEIWAPNTTHGAFAGDDLAGVCHWFPTRLSVPGEPLDAAAVTGVAVLSTHRRRGHLTRLMHAELRHIADAGVPAAALIAAEWPIYGRFGYGAATEACTIELDTGAARFRDAPTGSIVLVDPAALRAPLQAMHEARWARSPGAVLQPDPVWDMTAGLRPRPGDELDVKLQRSALWYDDAGTLGGAVVYKVEEHWVANRPAGVATVQHLYGATPEAERELWRHLCSVDWCRTAKGMCRAVDDPLPFWLEDARTAVFTDRSDHVWIRLLDLPAAFAARRSAMPIELVLEVDDPLGFVAGRWQVELGPDGGRAATTTAPADLRTSASALGAAFLGGHTLVRLAHAGLVEEEQAGALERASAALATPTAPWSPLSF